jgi:hypothetical protein
METKVSITAFLEVTLRLDFEMHTILLLDNSTKTHFICSQSTLCFQTNNIKLCQIYYQFHRMVLLVKKGGLISKLRRRLTVQGDSETIDGGTIAAAARKAASDKAEDVSGQIGLFSGPAFSSCIIERESSCRLWSI